MVKASPPPAGSVVRPVAVYDSDGQGVEVDSVSRGLVSVGSLLANLNSGKSYGVSHIFTGVLNGASGDLLISAPADFNLSIRFEFDAGGNAESLVFEEPTVSANGTEITPRNRNRTFPDASGVQVFHSPTVTDPGLELLDTFVPGGTGGNAAGGDDSTRVFVLAAGKSYLVRLTNRSGTTGDLSISVIWSEVAE